MAINVTEILGTDSLSGSRIVINDNFKIITSEINLMENYFDPNAGTITNLNDLKTQSLRVGLNTVLLDINASTFDILTDVRITGNVTFQESSIFINNIDPNTINDVFVGPSLSFDIGTSTAIPSYSTVRVGNASTSTLNLNLYDGALGQEITFVYSDATTGIVSISSPTGSLVLNGITSTNPKITLQNKGATVKLFCIDDGTGNGDWYVIGGDGYSLEV